MVCLSHCLYCLFFYVFVFFFKQKTAYEMRISDWSSDVCSSDLLRLPPRPRGGVAEIAGAEECVERLGDARQIGVHSLGDAPGHQIGRASCRERVCQYV